MALAAMLCPVARVSAARVHRLGKPHLDGKAKKRSGKIAVDIAVTAVAT